VIGVDGRHSCAESCSRRVRVIFLFPFTRPVVRREGVAYRPKQWRYRRLIKFQGSLYAARHVDSSRQFAQSASLCGASASFAGALRAQRHVAGAGQPAGSELPRRQRPGRLS
jgi:hypothetical protein